MCNREKTKKTGSISLDCIVDHLTPARRKTLLSMAGITLMNNLVTRLSEHWIITVGQPFKRPKNSLSNLFKNLTIVWQQYISSAGDTRKENVQISIGGLL